MGSRSGIGKRSRKRGHSPSENGAVIGQTPAGVPLLLFYGHSHPFSNFAPSPFELDGHRWSCGEQYFHYRKAVLFNDTEMMEAIKATTDPRQHKALGRKVRNYVEAEWAAADEDVMEDTCMAKFAHNPDLKRRLLDTGEHLLIEASPRDRKWGIGLGKDNPAAQDPAQWRGSNKLGAVLMRVRQRLRQQEDQARRDKQSHSSL